VVHPARHAAAKISEGFEKLRVIPPILKAIAEMGFENPTEVQQHVVPLMLQGSDVVVQSQTGTGKTAAFAISILQTVSAGKFVQALIVVPTRELCVQVVKEFADLGKYMEYGIVAVYGGVSMENQVSALKAGAQVVVATPGRLLDHLRQGTIRLERVHTLILDEADLMLDMGFIDDVRQIIQATPPQRQTSLFSATLPKEIADLSAEYLNAPEHVRIREEQLAVDLIDQRYLSVDPREKVSALATLLKSKGEPSTIVFCRTKAGADSLGRSLHSIGFRVEALHGNLTQARRERVMHGFREGRFNVLVATDVAARGLDIDDVDLIVNYNLPEDPKVYVHRIGRTARAGKRGEAVSFAINLAETRFLEQTAVFSNSKIEEMKIEIDRSLRPRFSHNRGFERRGHPQRFREGRSFGRRGGHDSHRGGQRGGFGRGGNRGGFSHGRGRDRGSEQYFSAPRKPWEG
jgi:ATP-dependent RNA helicase DeaD